MPVDAQPSLSAAQQGKISWATAFDDDVEEKFFPQSWELVVRARDQEHRRLSIVTQRRFGEGPLELLRRSLPGTEAPWLQLTLLVDGEVREYLPRDRSLLEVVNAGQRDNRLALRFDRLPLVDSCDREIELSDGDIDLRLESTEWFELLPEEDHLDQYPSEWFDGFFHLELDAEDEGFWDYNPFAIVEEGFDTGQPISSGVFVNSCAGARMRGAIVEIPQSVPEGSYRVDDTDFYFLGVSDLDLSFAETDLWIAAGGELYVERPGALFEYMQVHIATPIELVRARVEGGGIVTFPEDRLAIPSGEMKVWVQDEEP